MPGFSGALLLGNLLFSSIGFVAFIYGKKMHVWRTMLIGLLLMAFPCFTGNTAILYSIGAALTAALLLFRE